MAQPIVFNELANLTQVGIAKESCGFATLSMESEKYICVRESQGGKNQVVVLEMSDLKNPRRWPITADSAIMHPKEKIIALKSDKTLQVFNLDAKQKLKTTNMNDNVTFWKWLDESMQSVKNGFSWF